MVAITYLRRFGISIYSPRLPASPSLSWSRNLEGLFDCSLTITERLTQVSRTPCIGGNYQISLMPKVSGPMAKAFGLKAPALPLLLGSHQAHTHTPHFFYINLIILTLSYSGGRCKHANGAEYQWFTFETTSNSVWDGLGDIR